MLKSRKELLIFISYQIKIPVNSIESLSNGIIYSKLLNKIYKDFPINKIRNSIEQFHNLKILQTFFNRKGLIYNFSIERIIKGSVEENLELAKFICNLVKRKQEEGEGSFILKEELINKTEDYKESISLSHKENITNNIIDFNENLSKLLNGLEKERDFYYKKCLKIENLIKNKIFIKIKDIEDILYGS